MPNIALEQEIIAAAITIVNMLYLHASDVHVTNTARSTETEQRLCSEALTRRGHGGDAGDASPHQTQKGADMTSDFIENNHQKY